MFMSHLLISILGWFLFSNPIIYADYSDPDVIRVGDDYWMTASSFNCVPGLQILHSVDLVNWEVVGAALPDGPECYWDKAAGQPVEWLGTEKISDSYFTERPDMESPVQHGNGVWAPSIRYHDGQYLIFWGDPDYGVYQVHATAPCGLWSEPVQVIAGKGFIDPCPLWDEDGRVWLVHAWARSRCGFKSVLHVCELDPDCTKCIGPQICVFDGRDNGQETVEGPKFYKKDGWYWILAPAGGVKTGWQLAMRSKDILGPYDHRVVMEQGKTNINGPHQGGWVTDVKGKSWFIHFEDRYAWGRVLHLQPMTWLSSGWPVIGKDHDGDGVGNPVKRFRKPARAKHSKTKGQFARLLCQRQSADEQIELDETNFWKRRDLELMKIEGPSMVYGKKFELNGLAPSQRSGIVVLGRSYAAIEIQDGRLSLRVNGNAKGDGVDEMLESMEVNSPVIWLRVRIAEGKVDESRISTSDIPAECRFQYSFNGRRYHDFGPVFGAAAGQWIGAKVGAY